MVFFGGYVLLFCYFRRVGIDTCVKAFLGWIFLLFVRFGQELGMAMREIVGFLLTVFD
jgi:hypothetical protein